MLIYAIPFYLSTNNTSWINYYYQDNVNTMDALIMSVQMVMVGFVLHMVGGVYVAMLLAINGLMEEIQEGEGWHP
jgi:hypothetical protein